MTGWGDKNDLLAQSVWWWYIISNKRNMNNNNNNKKNTYYYFFSRFYCWGDERTQFQIIYYFFKM